MTEGVNLSAGMRNNLLLLQRANKDVESIQNKLATGNKVNSALDGPTQYFAAKGLSSRANDLGKLKEAMGQAISTIKAGDKGISSIESLIEQARGLTTTAYANLGTDASSVATRKSLSEQFNRIKEQIDSIAGDSGYQGKNLLAGNGMSIAATAASQAQTNSITGLSNSRVTNVVSADTYSLSVSGTGNVSGNSGDIAEAEGDRGLTSLKVSGKLDANQGNFSDIQIEMRGSVGNERTVVVTENGESRTINLFDNTQSASTSLETAGKSGTPQVSKVTIDGAIEEGDSFTVTVNGTAFSYTATSADVAGDDPEARREAVASALATQVNTALSADGFTLNTAATDGTFTITAGATQGTGVSFSLGASATNALEKDISISFSSGTTVSFTVDRTALDKLEGAANGTSTIEKNVDISVTATNLNGVSVTRSGTNDLGNGKLSEGENSLAFDTGTVRVTVDSSTILQAASASSGANLVTTQRTDPNTENDLAVQFNEDNSSAISVVSQNVTTSGQGLRVDYAQNGFLDRADIDKAVASLDYAKSSLRGASQALSTNLNIIQTRESFTDDFSNVLVEGANKLVQADQNQEGANLLALQTRQQLGTISLSLANQAQQSILRLF